jgi:hypothetical protein
MGEGWVGVMPGERKAPKVSAHGSSRMTNIEKGNRVTLSDFDFFNP